MQVNRKTQKLLAFAALLLVAGVAGVSCTKESRLKKQGGIVRFTASLGSGETRTSYSGEGTITGGLLTRERIDWSEGDLLRIYCPQATLSDNMTYPVDYVVESHETYSETVSRATIDAVGGNRLHWGAGEHVFYAMYPSAETSGFSAAEKQKVSLTETQLTGFIPVAQVQTWTAQTGAPDMKYAWMFATATTSAGSESVSLSFYPEFTAFEFEVGSGQMDEVDLTSFTLTTSGTGQALAGDFSYPLADVNTSSASEPLDLADFTFTNTSPVITVDFTQLPGGKLHLASSSPVTFTVLALPQTFSSLSITFTGDQIGTRTLALKDNTGTPLSFAARHKHRIRGLSFPSVLTFGGEQIDWDENVVGEDLIWDN